MDASRLKLASVQREVSSYHLMSMMGDIIADTVGTTDPRAQREPMLDFHIFGHNISHSLSPALHNAGFKSTRFPGHYRISESEHADASVKRLIHASNFGGASVTFPHKLEVHKFVDSISAQAKSIGAINTIVVKNTAHGRILEGENTDWSGIKSCIERADLQNLTSSCAVVLGAGGAARAACFALQALGIGGVIIVNRTQRTAEAMASNFPGLRSRLCTKLAEVAGLASLPVKIIIGCVPADDFDKDKIPPSLFSGSKEGVLVEMAYRPLVTGIMQVAEQNSGWKVFKGMDVLQEQAFAQFELWTGHEAPKQEMILAMNDELRRRQMTGA